MPLHEHVHPLVDAVTPVVAGVPDEALDAPTPCAEFDVRTLANHLLGTTEAMRRIGVGEDLDPGRYCGEGLAAWLPDIGAGESFVDWQGRAGVRPRPAAEVAALLDLHYCLDWGHVQALMNDEPSPGATLPYVIGQRRWALEWAVTFRGPYHQAPPRWDEVDLAS